MTSQRKIEANRRNSLKSCGPCTAAGKKIASRNAVQHDVWRMTYKGPESSPEVATLTRAFAADSQDPAVVDAAAKLAETEIVLKAIAQRKAAVLDQFADLSESCASPHNVDEPTHDIEQSAAKKRDSLSRLEER